MPLTRFSPIHFLLLCTIAAASEGYFESCQQLVSGGANVNSADFDGLTPLMVAAFEDKRYVVQLLIEAGAHLDAANRNGHTALHVRGILILALCVCGLGWRRGRASWAVD
jgi:ankyrin repeat protein